jgi:hypothetical protein
LANTQTERETMKKCSVYCVSTQLNSTQTSIAILSLFQSEIVSILNISLTLFLSLYTFPHMCSWIYSVCVCVWVSVFSHSHSSNTINHNSILYERESIDISNQQSTDCFIVVATLHKGFQRSFNLCVWWCWSGVIEREKKISRLLWLLWFDFDTINWRQQN